MVDNAKLARDIQPYIVDWVRDIVRASLQSYPMTQRPSVGSPTSPTIVAMEIHKLADSNGLGLYHLVSGLTAGHVLKATGATTAKFEQLMHSQTGGITPDDHHSRDHVLATDSGLGTTHSISGATAGHVLRASAANAAAFAQLQHDDLGDVSANQHHNKLHAMLDTTHHEYTGGAALDVFGLSAANTLAKLTPSDSVSSVQTAILKATNGALSIDALTAAAKVRAPLLDTAGVAHMTVAPGGRLILSPGEWVQLTDGKTIRSESFSSGFVGNGMRLDQGVAEAGRTTIEVDNLWVRGRMHVYELLIHQIRATNGSIFVSNTGKVVDVSGSGPYTLTTDPEHGFAVGDLIRAQRFTGTGVYQCNMQVTSVTNTKVFVATLSSGDAPAAGMDFARLGSASDANRRGGLYLTADDSGAPFMDIFDGVSSFATWNTPGVIKSRLGKLDGLGLPGSYTGEYGFYAGNGTTDTDAYVRLSNKTSRFNNVPLAMWSGGVQVGQWLSNGQLDIGFGGVGTVNDRDFTVHASGYVRIGRVGANMPNLLYTTGGDLQLRSNTTPVITLASDGNSYFSGVMTIGTGGEIRQGTVSSGDVWDSWVSVGAGFTGLRVWRDGSIGRLAGYSGGVLQAGFNSSGQITAGAGAVTLDASGINILTTSIYETNRSYSFRNAAGVFGGMQAYTAALYNAMSIFADSSGDTKFPSVTLTASGTASKPGIVILEAVGDFGSSVTITPTEFTVNPAAALFRGSVSVDSYIQAAGAVSGASGAFAGALTASNGELGMSIGAPYNGVSIRTPTGSWARGLRFRNSADVVLGGFGAYGTDNTINWYWIGNAYNDFSIRTYPTTGNTEVTGTLAVAETVNAGGAYKRDGTAGGIFVPMTPINLTDTGSTVWSGVSRAAGTYTFDVNSAANGSVPADAVAVAVMGTFLWTNSNSNTYATIQAPSAAYSIVARATASNMGIDVTGVVNISSAGQFTVTIVNATSNTSLLRIVGYYI